ncbi:hypothetical protein B0H11DRAFT_2200682 [Mycena galericulata]|nr:hypothetical protein B0H11DRAFT_2200682 [Mycena galericulata]
MCSIRPSHHSVLPSDVCVDSLQGKGQLINVRIQELRCRPNPRRKRNSSENGYSKSQRFLESGQEWRSRSQVCLLVWWGSKKLKNEVKATGSTGAKVRKKKLPRSKKSLCRRLRVE